MAAELTRPLVVPLVSGYAAVVLAGILDETLPARLERLQRQVDAGRLHPELLAELRAAWLSMRQVGEAWLAWRAAVDGNAAVQVTAMPRESAREIDTDTAAGLLGVSANRVRQLVRSGELPGRKAGRVWLVSAAAVQVRRVA